MDDGSALHLALRCGMARYLRLQELLAAANSCALLRCDAALVRQSVMETTDFDWFPAVLTDLLGLAVFLKRIVMRWCFVYENASPDGPWRDL
ncbi:hypothetical protein PybrP1_007228 [[Pythium] brassicae (nom. inval.)]|nr:hypothetical protein PybrP1_007228 [[Pythium] brassicae (nom. inval.)]